jgi:hypothetical protein
MYAAVYNFGPSWSNENGITRGIKRNNLSKERFDALKKEIEKNKEMTLDEVDNFK